MNWGKIILNGTDMAAKGLLIVGGGIVFLGVSVAAYFTFQLMAVAYPQEADMMFELLRSLDIGMGYFGAGLFIYVFLKICDLIGKFIHKRKVQQDA
jgi:hypothetical protein